MMRAAAVFVFCVFVAVSAAVPESSGPTAVHLVGNIYRSCLQKGSFACVKPKVLSFLSSSLKKDKILLTEDLAIVGNGRFLNDLEEPYDSSNVSDIKDEREKVLRYLMLDRIDQFLSTHELQVRIPKEIVSGDALPLVPEFLVKNIPAEVTVPLSETKAAGQERGFVKKVLIPFLLGLKFKATALVPLAFALIALKTWKAMTLGLLSLVLSGAMVIFKFTKPKVVNYEVYHYPSHGPAAPAVEHGYDQHHGYGRSDVDAQTLAYRK